MSGWIAKNAYLTIDEQRINGELFASYFLSKGWSLNAICGMLGNIQTESTTNPGVWENLDEGNLNVGFGLVQWTPASKYIDWSGSDYLNGDKQCERIVYERDNGLQWIPTSTYPMSFKEFSTSSLPPYDLAMIFIANYERPLNPNQPIRGIQANEWYKYLTDNPPIPPTPTNKKKMPLWFYMKRRV